ncbi:MAG: glycoside hydrolase N-terminal domain-containing protein [Planctomycetaceae bacterium]|jgi:alpha-L-fucosidase 2|nr:glycoside hydrolase N-terminal domain-containing protein [Planctomycetaceae bacterium]
MKCLSMRYLPANCFAVSVLFCVLTASVFAAELPLHIGADQNRQNQFLGTILEYTFYETLTPDGIKTLADSPVDKKSPQIKGRIEPDSKMKDAAVLNKIGAAAGWIRPDRHNQGNCRIFDRITPGESDGWLLDLFPGRKLRLIHEDITIRTDMEIPVEQWTHVAAVFDGNNAAVFVNGKQVAGEKQTAATVVSDKTPAKHSEIIWCSKPAKNWFENMPIGNGHLGAMLAGSVEDEIISLNHDDLWSGEPRDLQKPETYKALPEIRKLLLEGKNAEAQKAVNAEMLGPWQCSYQPLGNLELHFDYGKKNESAANYRRELDLREGLVRCSYDVNGVHYERESFASYPDNVIVFTVRSDKPAINLDIKLTTVHKTFDTSSAVSDNSLTVAGYTPVQLNVYDRGAHNMLYDENRGTRFFGGVKVTSEGGENLTEEYVITEEVNDSNMLKIRNAKSVRIYFTAATSYIDPWTNPAVAKEEFLKTKLNVPEKPVEELKKTHIADYQSFYNRVRLDVNGEKQNVPMEKRIQNFSLADDPQLAVLYYQFGRYLLISGSRPGSQPMNLQGIWNKDFIPAWASNWTLNCNAEINYWAVETANLSELHQPLIRLTKELSADGAKTAKNMYNARGWIAHHNADVWRTTWTVSGTGLWSIYQVGSAWLCHSAYDHYLFTGDKKFLADFYPVMKGAAQFYLDTLQEDTHGYLTTNPATSFENQYRRQDGFAGWATCGAMQDIQIIRALFRNTLEAAGTLGIDADFQSEVEKAMKRLPPNTVSPSRGDLQEWVEDWDPSSRNGQTAHGWALNPDWDISPVTTPELAAAMRKTLELRRPWETYNCASWVSSMPAGYWAKLFDGKMVEEVLNRHVNRSVNSSLNSTFGGKGSGSWQNDGNLGMTAAIGESLLQSVPGAVPEIRILPALFPSWKSGKVSGLCARGGFTADIVWSPEEITATIHSTWGTKTRVRCGDKVEEIEIPPGGEKTMTTVPKSGKSKCEKIDPQKTSHYIPLSIEKLGFID